MLLTEAYTRVSEDNIVVTSGRVRAGYEIGEIRFEKSDPNRFKRILHMIGEWPCSKGPSRPVGNLLSERCC
jgi:ethanolamine ammonia-lyase large subunit